MDLSDTVASFASQFALRPEDIAAVLGVSYSAARNLLKGAAPTDRRTLERIEAGLARNESAATRDELRLAEVP